MPGPHGAPTGAGAPVAVLPRAVAEGGTGPAAGLPAVGTGATPTRGDGTTADTM